MHSEEAARARGGRRRAGADCRAGAAGILKNCGIAVSRAAAATTARCVSAANTVSAVVLVAPVSAAALLPAASVSLLPAVRFRRSIQLLPLALVLRHPVRLPVNRGDGDTFLGPGELRGDPHGLHRV